MLRRLKPPAPRIVRKGAVVRIAGARDDTASAARAYAIAFIDLSSALLEQMCQYAGEVLNGLAPGPHRREGAFDPLGAAVAALPETDDPAADLVEAGTRLPALRT